jgi:uncharacterized metal-binding protein
MGEKRCTCSSMDVRVVACSGGSNVGQIANDAAIQLAKEKAASFFCLAGVGGHIGGIVKSAKEAGLMIAIDGCSVQCAAKTLHDEKACSLVVEKLKDELAA